MPARALVLVLALAPVAHLMYHLLDRREAQQLEQLEQLTDRAAAVRALQAMAPVTHLMYYSLNYPLEIAAYR